MESMSIGLKTRFVQPTSRALRNKGNVLIRHLECHKMMKSQREQDLHHVCFTVNRSSDFSSIHFSDNTESSNSSNSHHASIDPSDWPSSSANHLDDGHVLYDPRMPETPGRSSPLFTTPILSQAGLWVHTECKIVICASCGIAWRPSRVLGHVKKTHQVQIKRGDEEEIMSLIQSHGITDDSPVITPMAKSAPVELIKVHENGFCCTICDFCCPSARTFDNHWSRHHRNHPIERRARFHRSDLQTFFDPVPCKYFEVASYLRQVPIGSAFDIYIKNELPKQPSFQPTIPIKDREIPPFLQVTQWHTHLAQYLTNGESRKALRDMVQLPKGLQKNKLHSVVLQYMQTVSKKAAELPYQLRCLLIECPRCVKMDP